MITTEFSAQSIDDLTSICDRIVAQLSPPLIIGLSGDMGSGKTTFVRSFCHSLNSPDWVNSPTYSMIQRYSSPAFDILHIDLYRCANHADIDQLDIPSLITPKTIAFIEWIEATELFSPDISIQFNVCSDHTRTLRISGTSDWIRSLDNANTN